MRNQSGVHLENHVSKRSNYAIIMIHGLGGTCHDFGSLDRHFKKTGYDVFSPSLPGHGSHPRELKSVTFADYMLSLTTLYRHLLTTYCFVDIVGISMGALLALILSAREGITAGRLILLSPPMYLDGWRSPRLRFLRHMLYRLPLLPKLIRIQEDEPYGIKNERIRSLIRKQFSNSGGAHYRYVPLSAIEQVDKMRSEIFGALDPVKCKVLIIHSEQDEVTSIRSAEFIRDNIANGGSSVEILRLKDSFHMITLDNERDVVKQRSVSFLHRKFPQNLKLPFSSEFFSARKAVNNHEFSGFDHRS